MRHRYLAVVVAALTTVVVTPAGAGDVAAAEALFVEAKKLVAKRRYAEACPKFAESNRLDRGAGTLIHLADCLEKNRQTASAWATFKEAASAAQALGRSDWERLASQRASALERQFATLTVNVRGAEDKLEITRDGNAVSQASYGVALPADIGKHTIEASAPGRKTFRASVEIVRDGEHPEVVVPALELAPEEPPRRTAALSRAGPSTAGARDASATSRGGGSTQRTLGLVAGGLGVAGLGVGAVTGLLALRKHDEASAECASDGPCASRAAVDANASAKTLGSVSTVSFAAGGALVAAGVVLWLTGRRDAAPSALTVTPAGSATTGSIVVSGAF